MSSCLVLDTNLLVINDVIGDVDDNDNNNNININDNDNQGWNHRRKMLGGLKL